MGKYVFGLIDRKGKVKIYASNSSRTLKRIRSRVTKSKATRPLEVSRILKSTAVLPMMFKLKFKVKEAMA